MRRSSALALLLLSAFLASPLHAATMFSVDGRTTGSFGTYGPSLVRDGLDLVEGLTFAGAGEQVELSATGSVFLGTGALPTTSPDGAGPFDRASFLGFPAAYLPLEEAFADSGGILATSFDDIGALFAAFVPEATAASGGFLARNTDLGGSILASSLFFVGSGPFLFTAPEAGRLYFGVNDSLGLNNTGGYTVTVEVVPEPSTASLLALGLVGLAARRRRVN